MSETVHFQRENGAMMVAMPVDALVMTYKI